MIRNRVLTGTGGTDKSVPYESPLHIPISRNADSNRYAHFIVCIYFTTSCRISQGGTTLALPPVKWTCFYEDFLLKKLQNDFKKQID